MSVDLDRQLREYCRSMDEQQVALSFDDILERRGELQVIPRRGSRHLSPPRKSMKTDALRPGRGLAWAVAAFVVILALGGLYFAFSGGDGDVVDQTTVPSPATTEAAPTTEAPDPSEGSVHGWPETMTNEAGVYSWGGSRCAGQSCVSGYMHNGYGSGDVEIQINPAAQWPINDDGATGVTVAGQDGIYLRSEIDPGKETWYVDIEGTRIAISLTAKAGTSQADLEEAHAIIDSIRVEPYDDRDGFRLVFTLTTDDWDSG